MFCSGRSHAVLLGLVQGAHYSGCFSGQTFTLMEACSPSLNGAVGMDGCHCTSTALLTP